MGLDFVSRSHAEREDPFNWIVTEDEKWVCHFTSKIKSPSKQWVAKCDTSSMKLKRERSGGKVYLVAIFYIRTYNHE